LGRVLIPDRTIKVFDTKTLELLVTIGDGQPERHRGAINEINISKEYMYVLPFSRLIISSPLSDIHGGRADDQYLCIRR
jgi:hypothetical protein